MKVANFAGQFGFGAICKTIGKSNVFHTLSLTLFNMTVWTPSGLDSIIISPLPQSNHLFTFASTAWHRDTALLLAHSMRVSFAFIQV